MSFLHMTLKDLMKQNKKPRSERNLIRSQKPNAATNKRPKPPNKASRLHDKTWRSDRRGSEGQESRPGRKRRGSPKPNATTNEPSKPPKPYRLHDIFSGRVVSMETEVLLRIYNLDHRVSGEDVKELFSVIGELKQCSIHHDGRRRWKVRAEVLLSMRYCYTHWEANQNAY